MSCIPTRRDGPVDFQKGYTDFSLTYAAGKATQNFPFTDNLPIFFLRNRSR